MRPSKASTKSPNFFAGPGAHKWPQILGHLAGLWATPQAGARLNPNLRVDACWNMHQVVGHDEAWSTLAEVVPVKRKQLLYNCNGHEAVTWLSPHYTTTLCTYVTMVKCQYFTRVLVK